MKASSNPCNDMLPAGSLVEDWNSDVYCSTVKIASQAANSRRTRPGSPKSHHCFDTVPSIQARPTFSRFGMILSRPLARML